MRDSMLVQVKETPCSGKIDIQYIIKSFEKGVSGLCVVTCPENKCSLAQGNKRAMVRINTVKKLLAEIGLEPGRAELICCEDNMSQEQFKSIIENMVAKLSAFELSPLSRDHSSKCSMKSVKGDND